MGSENETRSKLNVSKVKIISKGCDMKSGKTSDKSWTHIHLNQISRLQILFGT